MNQSMESMLGFRHCLFLETKFIHTPPRIIAFGRHHLFGSCHQLQHNGPGSVPWTVHCCPGRPAKLDTQQVNAHGLFGYACA